MTRALFGAALALASALAAGSVARATDPGFYRVGAELGTPVEVRWLDVGPQEIVVSDLTAGVAAVRLETGVVAWSRVVEGGLSGVWSQGAVVLVAGGQLTAYRRSVGTRLWERSLRCDAAGACGLRVVHVDARGVFVALGGVVQDALQQLDLETGEEVWGKPIAAAHPNRVLGDAKTLVLEDGLPPFALRFIDKTSGRERGQWVPRVGGAARPVSDLWLDARGEVTAAELRPRDGSLARAVLLDPNGREVRAVTVPRPEGVTTSPIFAASLSHRLALFLPDPAGGRGQLVTADLAGAPGPPRVEPVATWRRPVQIGERWVFVGQVEGVLTAWGLDPKTGAAVWQRTLGGVAADVPVELRAVGGLAVITARAQPLVVWSLEPADGQVIGFRQLRLDGARVGAIAADAEGLLLAVGAVVEKLTLEPVARAAAAFEDHLTAGRSDDARALAAELAPLAPHSAVVRDMLARGAGTRLDEPARLLAAGDLAGGIDALGALVDQAADASAWVELLGPCARHVGRHLLGARRALPRAVVDALVGLGARLTRATVRHAAAFQTGGALASRQGEVQRALVVLAVALDRLKEPAAAADLLEPLRQPGWGRGPELTALDRAVCTRALDGVVRATRRGLLSARPDQRSQAARALELFHHGDVALSDPGYLERAAQAAADDEPRYARDSARALDKELAERLRGLRREIGAGYTAAGCALACASLGSTCPGGCYAPAQCAASEASCATGCGRGGVPKWTLPAADRACVR